tara:strand:+ start:1912 stop:2256 length:345 start_codon:yes stop_codon:yes gene_type:complete
MRHKYTSKTIDKFTENRVLVTTQYPEIIRQDSDVLYTTKFDDTLYTLSYRFYGTIENWWIIARANAPFKARSKFPPGTRLIIPIEIEDFLSEFAMLNLQEDASDEGETNTSTGY